MTLDTILLLLILLISGEILLVIAVILNKLHIKNKAVKIKNAETYLINRYFKNESVTSEFSPSLLIRVFVRLSEQVQLSLEQWEKAFRDFDNFGIIKKYQRDLNSIFILKRKQAIFFLSYFLTTNIQIALLRRLRIEKIDHVKIFLVNALKNNMDQSTVQTFIDSIVGSRRFYQSRIIEIIKSHFLSSHTHFPDIYNRSEIEIKELFVDLAESLYNQDFIPPLQNELVIIENHLSGKLNPAYTKMRLPRINRLYHHILSVLTNVYGYNLDADKYINNSDSEVVHIALESMAKTKTFDQILYILHSADNTSSDEFRIRAITKIIDTNKMYFDKMIELTNDYLPLSQKQIVAKILVLRVEYLILKLFASNSEQLKMIIAMIIESQSTADLISFLNRNRNHQIETTMINIIKPIAQANPVFFQELNDYLNSELFHKMGFVKTQTKPLEKPRSGPEKSKIRWLIPIIFVAFMLMPMVFVIARYSMFSTSTLAQIGTEYIVLMNEVFVFYYLSINCIYIILALLSTYGANRQSRLWRIKSKSMLFQKGMLASISIIAPAYNEEMSIVESVNSLLNLNYPDFEVIVINDGSKDATLERLIDHFKLERKNVPYNELLKARPIKAIFKNKYYPNLTVIDKANGGKADALNVGINLAKSDYICGIDADSILESESLLKLMSSMLDHDKITLALGGCIFPVNGCEVDHGQIESKGLSKNLLARLQTIEYLRAFSLGRVGWSVIDSLLIVSGAFGLFEKQILIECGGYLTQSTKEKDTVGEDMELVVRITRQAYDTNLRFRIDYIHNAVCYTEVPEETKSLLKQRNRWQRGLVDILSYHRKMIGNAHYKQAGLIATPYFFFFEMFGPMLEIQGYLAVAIGLIFGLLTINIIILLMIVTMLMGIVLSLLALLVTEHDSICLSIKDTLLLILIAIFETFGWRQFMGMYRIKGVFSSLKDTNAWGTVKRVGFTK